MDKLLTFTESLREATEQSLTKFQDVIMLGLGVSYKNGADGTMGDLYQKFPERIFDTPVSEACVTGAGVGAAITGLRPIIHHGRVEFALFAIDQIVTQASKWNYMFGGDNKVPIVFRIAIGRQWGNGPQHTQGLYSLFGSVPGLKVVIPSSPSMAKGLLNSAIIDNNPVVFLEPRWLYGLKGNVKEEYFTTSLSDSRYVKRGTHLTIVSYGDGVYSSYEASKMILEYGIETEIIDLVSINPIDYSKIEESIKKTNKLLCVDTTNNAFNIGSEVISKITQSCFHHLSQAPINISTPDLPCPTSTHLTDIYYPTRLSIANKIMEMFGLNQLQEDLTFEELNILPKVEVEF